MDSVFHARTLPNAPRARSRLRNLVRSTSALLTGMSLCAGTARGATKYTATFQSIDQHPPAPEWFKDAKFGIYFHWGAFGTAQFGFEWYPSQMYDKTTSIYQHHLSAYGDPFSDWPFDKFITGANDKSGQFTQFAPKLVSDGGKWDPDAWAQLFVDAGARFAGPVMEHHDGFSMWDSQVNEWNSLSKGPQLNLAKLHVDAFRRRGLKILAAMHHAFHFTGYYNNAPNPADPSLKKLYGKLATADENQLWFDKLKEVIDEFQPDILWQDFNLAAVDQTKLLQFAAYYYNAAIDWNKEVVATYKDGFNANGEVFDFERGGPGDIVNPYWLTDDTVSAMSWCYVTGMTYYTDTQIVHSFIDRVSKNGNLLLNISPMPDGTIPQRQKDILLAMGAFLKQFGTAIYNTRAWTVYGEGPTKMGGGAFTAPTAGTASDIRYTASKDGDAVYAILLGWPNNGTQVTFASVTTSRFAVGTGKVFLFGPVGGSAIALPFTQDGSGLHVTLPAAQPYTAIAYALKITKSGTVPAPTPTIDGVSITDAGIDSGADVATPRRDGGPDGATSDAAGTSTEGGGSVPGTGAGGGAGSGGASSSVGGQGGAPFPSGSGGGAGSMLGGTDAGPQTPATQEPGSGCACEMGRAPSAGLWLLATAAAVGAAVRLRRRRGP